MPARDVYHAAVVNALVKDGWTITHDPYTMTFGPRSVFVDIGAERVIAAEKGSEKIAVEVKVFQGPSDIRDLEAALGQYVFYRSLLRRIDPNRILFLAVPERAFVRTLDEPIARPVLQDLAIPFLTFDPESEEVVSWKR